MTQLQDAHVLITGGSSGIGLETARRALARGARVSIVARDPERLADALHGLERGVGDETRVAAAPADVTDPEHLDAAVTLLVAQFGPVDVLVTCAGRRAPATSSGWPTPCSRTRWPSTTSAPCTRSATSSRR